MRYRNSELMHDVLNQLTTPSKRGAVRPNTQRLQTLARKLVGPLVSLPLLERLWNALCEFIQNQLNAQRGVVIPKFGRFTLLKEPKSEMVFIVSEEFIRHNSLSLKRKLYPSQAACVEVNHLTLASMAETDREVVKSFLETIVRCIGRALRDPTTVLEIEWGNVGKMLGEACNVVFVFGDCSSMDKSELYHVTDGSATFVRDAPPEAFSLKLDARSNQEGVSYAVGSRMASRQRERNRLAKGVSGLGSTIPTDLQLNLIGQDQVHSPQLGSPSRKIPTRSSTRGSMNSEGLHISGSSGTPLKRDFVQKPALPFYLQPDYVPSMMKRQGLQVASPTNSVESSTPYQTGMAIAVQRFLCDLEREKEIQAKKDAEIRAIQRHQEEEDRKRQEARIRAQQEMNAMLKKQAQEKNERERKEREEDIMYGRRLISEKDPFEPHPDVRNKIDSQRHLRHILDQQVIARKECERKERDREINYDKQVSNMLCQKLERECEELRLIHDREKQELRKAWETQNEINRNIKKLSEPLR